ncbi:MAG: M23 family metallopeptidase [Bacillota bacterium]|nr:M23 family metallopeptidase [Bacillota bacterium]
MTLGQIKQFLTAHGEKPLILGIIGVLFLGTILVGSLTNMNKAYAIVVDGYQVALVAEQQLVEEALEEVIAEKSEDAGQAVTHVQEIEVLPVKAKGDRLTADQLANLFNNTLEFTTAGVAIIINGKQQLIVENRETADKLLEEAKTAYIKQNDSTEMLSVVIEDQVQLETVEIGIGGYTDYETALALLINGVEKVESHVVAAGESLWTIARDNNMTTEELKEANPQLATERLQIGQELSLVKLEPMVSVVATLRESKKETVPFSTRYVNDSNMYRGQEKVTQAGQRGEREVVYELVQVNGVTTDKKELEAKVLSQPTERVVARGTKVIVASRGSGEAGRFGWPVSGTITSPFGNRRGGYHYGIDIAASTGTSIRVASAGVVTFSGWSGNYGNMIEIDHGNGVSTRYAHNSANLVSAGKEVNAGDVIGRVGSTGRSTGPHVHFEVRINGQAKNPMNYLP